MGSVTPRPTVTLGGTALTAFDRGGVILETAELGGVILLRPGGGGVPLTKAGYGGVALLYPPAVGGVPLLYPGGVTLAPATGLGKAGPVGLIPACGGAPLDIAELGKLTLIDPMFGVGATLAIAGEAGRLVIDGGATAGIFTLATPDGGTLAIGMVWFTPLGLTAAAGAGYTVKVNGLVCLTVMPCAGGGYTGLLLLLAVLEAWWYCTACTG